MLHDTAAEAGQQLVHRQFVHACICTQLHAPRVHTAITCSYSGSRLCKKLDQDVCERAEPGMNSAMESLPLEPDPPFFTDNMAAVEEDPTVTDQMPVNLTTINASANPSGQMQAAWLNPVRHHMICYQLFYAFAGDPFAVTAVLSRQLSVTRKEWLKYTANQEDPDAPLYTQETLAKALQTPGNEHLVTNTSFLTICPAPEHTGIFSFASKFRHR